MEKNINERILTFKEYCLLMLRTAKERFWQTFGAMLLFALFMILATVGIILIGGIIIAQYLPYPYLSNIYAWQYIDSQAIISQIAPAIPAMIGIGIILIVVIMFFACAQNAMIYLIADSVACKVKRDFGSILSFAFKRAFPSMGTAVLLSLIAIGIFIIFGILLSVIFVSMGFSSYMLYTFDINSLWQLSNMSTLTIIFVILSLIMLGISIYISIMYSMAQLARVKYKFSAVASLRYSRRLTKGKRGKIFGNLLLIGIFYGILVWVLSIIPDNISNFSIPLIIPFIVVILIALIRSFASYMLYIFTSFIFINFDKFKGKNIFDTFASKVVNVKDIHFTNYMQQDEMEQRSINETSSTENINKNTDNLQENSENNFKNMDIINKEDEQNE
jgi:hypothetical protein